MRRAYALAKASDTRAWPRRDLIRRASLLRGMPDFAFDASSMQSLVVGAIRHRPSLVVSRRSSAL